MSSTQHRKIHIRPLTSLRFFFALMVYCCHINFLQSGDLPWVKDLYLSTLVEGFLGVSFFFILSGFIIAYNYLYRFESGRIVRKDFYKARVARLYPLTLICIVLAIPEYLFYHWDDGIAQLGFAFLANISLLQSYIPFKDIYMSYNYPDWSISTEMFFYVCFPIIVYALSKSKSKIRALLVVTLILLITILVAIPQTSKAL